MKWPSLQNREIKLMPSWFYQIHFSFLVVNLIKHYWPKFTHIFRKLDYLIVSSISTIELERSSFEKE
jgi:hypothetical protein